MRDEIDRRSWAEHHYQFALSVDRGMAKLGARLARAVLGTPPQLVAVVGALAFTAFSLGLTSATA